MVRLNIRQFTSCVDFKRSSITILFSIMLVILGGCSKKKIDSSSDERLKKSIEAVKASLNEEKKKEFEEAIQAIAFSDIGNIFEAAANPDSIKRKIKDKLDGKTADEVIDEGNRIITERKEKEREQSIDEIKEIQSKLAELEVKRLKTEQDREKLKQFKVLRSRFYYNKSSFTEEPAIELTVKNDTTYPVSRAYFDGVLATPGRVVPWVVDSFNYSISGGLEPGEEVTWQLSPNMFGEWGKAPKDRNDMVLTVNVTRIDGADNKPIFDSEFSEWDKEKLKELSNRIEELKKNLVKLQ